MYINYMYILYVCLHIHKKYGQIYTNTLHNGFLERLLHDFPFKIFTMKNTKNTKKVYLILSILFPKRKFV